MPSRTLFPLRRSGDNRGRDEKGPERTVAACRAPDGNIVHKILREGTDEQKRNFWYKTPILRGVLILVDSLSIGYRALMFSGEVADPDSGPRNPFIENTMMIGSLIIALIFFKYVPILVAKGTLGVPPAEAERAGIELLNASMAWSAVEGLVKIILIIGYMLTIRAIFREIRRVFQYHGAEHKTINAYEAGVPLTVNDIEAYPTFHPRCGTSFMFAVILFSLLFAMMFPLITWWIAGDPRLALKIWVRLILHIIFLPIISAFGYEFIRLTARLNPNGLVMRFLTWPGRFFQKITALEPERDMLEVALVSMRHAMGIENPEPEKDISSAP
ncbi:MAG TPA: DUF1385 domain-containing protein [Firmicutes bacterium]|nr:DUF1385 domain-containing protein [Bacillota bacterium]